MTAFGSLEIFTEYFCHCTFFHTILKLGTCIFIIF